MRTSQRTVESAKQRTDRSVTDDADTSDDVLLPADSEVSPTLSIVMPTLNEEAGVAECIRQIKRVVAELNVPKLIDMGHGLGIEFTHKTVGDAFRALTIGWDCFEYREGSGTKAGANKRLIAAESAIPDALWQRYVAETGETATGADAFSESSKDPREDR